MNIGILNTAIVINEEYDGINLQDLSEEDKMEVEEELCLDEFKEMRVDIDNINDDNEVVSGEEEELDPDSDTDSDDDEEEDQEYTPQSIAVTTTRDAWKDHSHNVSIKLSKNVDGTKGSIMIPLIRYYISRNASRTDGVKVYVNCKDAIIEYFVVRFLLVFS